MTLIELIELFEPVSEAISFLMVWGIYICPFLYVYDTTRPLALMLGKFSILSWFGFIIFTIGYMIAGQ